MTAWRKASLAAFFLVQAGLIGAAGAQGPETSPQPDDEIVVTAERLREMVWEFVGSVSVTPSREDQLARWNQRICPGVIGIRARYGQFIADRISQHAIAIGLRAGRPGCRANVVVFVTPDSDMLAREIATQYRALVGAAGRENTHTLGGEALDAFANTPRPVRWWHVSNTVSADGQVLGDVQASQSGGQIRAQTIRTTSLGFGRLARTTRQDFSRVIVIVDARRAVGQQFETLADYLAMVALAQLDPNADTAPYDTILNLFADRPPGAEAPAALTAWDQAYLEGLYDAPRNARNAGQQEGAIARSMAEDLGPGY